MKNTNQFPNLFLLGVQKAGTTMLYDMFKDHPSIYLPENKEPHYFSYNAYYEKGLEYYKQYYESVGNQKYVGDFTPDYLFWPLALERMKPFLNKDTKFIVSLRQPSLRAYSQYNMMVSRGFHMNSFETDLYNEEVNTSNPSQKNLLRPSHMIARGLYAVQLKRLFSIVAKEKVKIIIFEEWVKSKEKTVKEIEDFLEIPSFERELNSQNISNPTLIYPSNPLVKQLKKINNILLKSAISRNKYLLKAKENFRNQLGAKPEPLTKEQIQDITNTFFLKDIQECERILGRDLSIWY